MNKELEQQPLKAGRAARIGRRAPNSTSWTKGKSGNPAGRSKTGASWGEIYRDVTDKTAEELSAEVGGKSTKYGRELADLPHGIAIKRLIAIRLVLAILAEPSASLLNAMVTAETIVNIEARMRALEHRPEKKGKPEEIKEVFLSDFVNDSRKDRKHESRPAQTP